MCFWRKKPKTVDELIEVCKRDPRRIFAWILRNIWYVSDQDNHNRKDYHKTPEETLTGIYRDGLIGTPYSGDCEDFCILAYVCLEKIGIESTIICVFTPTSYAGDIPRNYKGHAVLAVELDDRWYHFSNWGLKRCNSAERVQDIHKYVYTKGYWYKAKWDGENLISGKKHLFKEK
jgi:predicted transglutaminase-like cysteine proteinase